VPFSGPRRPPPLRLDKATAGEPIWLLAGGESSNRRNRLTSLFGAYVCSGLISGVREPDLLTPCMPCSFGPRYSPWSAALTQLGDCRGLTVVVRWVPLVTAACGTRVARPARTNLAQAWQRWSPAQAMGEVRPRTTTWLVGRRAERGSRIHAGRVSWYMEVKPRMVTPFSLASRSFRSL
jgi:hypothetical protein